MPELNNLATLQKRAISFVIDDFLTNILFVVIFFEQLGSLKTPEDIVFFIKANYWVLVMIKLLYHTFFTWQSGMTLGKHMLKVKVVSAHNNQLLSLQASFARAVVRIIDETIFYIGFLPAFFTPLKQTLHDRVVRSIVINA